MVKGKRHSCRQYQAIQHLNNYEDKASDLNIAYEESSNTPTTAVAKIKRAAISKPPTAPPPLYPIAKTVRATAVLPHRALQLCNPPTEGQAGAHCRQGQSRGHLVGPQHPTHPGPQALRVRMRLPHLRRPQPHRGPKHGRTHIAATTPADKTDAERSAAAADTQDKDVALRTATPTQTTRGLSKKNTTAPTRKRQPTPPMETTAPASLTSSAKEMVDKWSRRQ